MSDDYTPVFTLTLSVAEPGSVDFAFEVLEASVERKVPAPQSDFSSLVPLVYFDLDLDLRSLTVRGWEKGFQTPFRNATTSPLRKAQEQRIVPARG